ncbi:MAG: type II CAAX endopeptidase family protein [Candidatus Aminicenantes bacterium]|jgi:membrane protease YdiL (CAAX protease family)
MSLCTKKILVIVELGVLLLLIFARIIHVFPFSSIVYAFVFVLGSLFLRQIGLNGIGLSSTKSWSKTVLLGIGVGIFLQFLSLHGIEPILAKLTGHPPDLSSFAALKGNTKFLFMWLAISWTVAAFGEEIVYRGYVINRVTDLIGKNRTAWLVSLFCSATLFGLIHYYQGTSGMISTGVSGLVFGILYLATKRNLWGAILAHGAYDTVGFLLIFFGKYPGT